MDNPGFKLSAQLLDLASDVFSNHGCNDFRLERTPDNIALVEDMIAKSDDPDRDIIFIMGETDVMLLNDVELMDYCASELRS